MQLNTQDDEIDALDVRVVALEEDCIEKQDDIDDLEDAVDGLLSMKAMLAMGISDNTALITALDSRVETNEDDISNIMTLVTNNGSAITTLQMDVINNAMAIGDVEGEVDTL